MNIKQLCGGLICTVFILAGVGRSFPALAESLALEDYTSYDNSFEASVPAGWVRTEDIGNAGTGGETWVDLRGPQNEDGAFTGITFIYYHPDHPRFTSTDKFIRVNTDANDGLLLPGENVGPVVPVTVAGIPARQFERRTFIFIPPYAVDPVKIPMFERVIVLEGKKGFYVLKFSSPENVYQDYLGIFEEVAGSFKPLDAGDAS